jgi:hypothetical protein
MTFRNLDAEMLYQGHQHIKQQNVKRDVTFENVLLASKICT